MIGGLSSSLSTALRTAGTARKTMDTMARQMATGQRVSSVKDDGAAWSRANAMKAESSQRNLLSDQLDLTTAGVRWARQGTEVRMAHIAAAKSLAALGRLEGASASTAAARQAEYSQARESFNKNTYGTMGTDLRLTRADGTGPWAPASNSLLSATTLAWTVTTDAGVESWTASSLTPATNSAATASIATTVDADTAYAVWVSAETIYTDVTSELGALENRLDRTSENLRRGASRLAAASDSLTDADLGAASTQLRQSETRQQLALDTISRALSAYSNYAGGLLGNVQRTQRGVLA